MFHYPRWPSSLIKPSAPCIRLYLQISHLHHISLKLSWLYQSCVSTWVLTPWPRKTKVKHPAGHRTYKKFYYYFWRSKEVKLISPNLKDQQRTKCFLLTPNTQAVRTCSNKLRCRSLACRINPWHSGISLPCCPIPCAKRGRQGQAIKQNSYHHTNTRSPDNSTDIARNPQCWALIKCCSLISY